MIHIYYKQTTYPTTR